MDRYLIINADDYGYNPQQTDAVTQLYEAGLITSTSVMTVAQDARRAAETARDRGMPVGVHLTINSDSRERPWRSLSGARSLSDGAGLYCGQLPLALHARRADVAAELEAQYRFLSDAGCTVDHADNHCGTLYGINGRRFYVEAYRFCARHHLPYRFPKTSGYLDRMLHRRAPRPLLALQRRIVAVGERYGVPMLDDLVSNPDSVERIGNYENLRRYYLDAVDGCIAGITEMFLHPAYPIEGDPGWQKRVWEFELLRSGDLLQRARERGVRVVSWGIFRELKPEDTPV